MLLLICDRLQLVTIEDAFGARGVGAHQVSPMILLTIH